MARKRKKREHPVDIGMSADKYHRLFVKRLEREGRYIAFQKRRSELYHSEDWNGHWKWTWMPVAKEFGFISKKDEVERFEKFMLSGSRTKMSEELREMQDEIKEEQADQRIENIPDGDDLELPSDIAWVYSHPAMLRACDGAASLKPSDYDGAPNKGAAGMLLYAMNNKRDFYKMVLSHLSKKDVQGEGDKDMEDDLRDIKEIDAMLQQL
jgi:hypothetical protein